MTKFLTAAAWSAFVLGGVAIAETPPAESTDAAIEEESVTEADAPTDITTIRIGDEIEAEAETEADATVASAVVEGDMSAGGEEPEAEEADAEPTETE